MFAPIYLHCSAGRFKVSWYWARSSMAGHEMMSSKAAAFSIANLLNNDTKLDEQSSSPDPVQQKRNGYAITSLLQNATQSNEPKIPQFTSTLPTCFNMMRNFDFSASLPKIAMREVQVALQQSDLWWKFYSCGTEMVITRTGRWDQMGGSCNCRPTPHFKRSFVNVKHELIATSSNLKCFQCKITHNS